LVLKGPGFSRAVNLSESTFSLCASIPMSRCFERARLQPCRLNPTKVLGL
jgi:hypothetical protein